MFNQQIKLPIDLKSQCCGISLVHQKGQAGLGLQNLRMLNLCYAVLTVDVYYCSLVAVWVKLAMWWSQARSCVLIEDQSGSFRIWPEIGTVLLHLCVLQFGWHYLIELILNEQSEHLCFECLLPAFRFSKHMFLKAGYHLCVLQLDSNFNRVQIYELQLVSSNFAFRSCRVQFPGLQHFLGSTYGLFFSDYSHNLKLSRTDR